MIKDCKELVDYISQELEKTVDIAVVGLSGGADSTLTAILCTHALGKENVYGVSMPYNEVDENTFNSLSAITAVKLCVNHYVRPVAEIADAITKQIALDDGSDVTDVNKGNSRSRARMSVLYGVAHAVATEHGGKRVRVMGTGNLSEDFIGYDTKGGDALADLFAIGELYKSEVYQLLDYFRDLGFIDEESINRTPSAGLEDNQTDEADLGYSYNDMEQGIRYCLKNYADINIVDLDEVTKFVWQRHNAHKHKHEAPSVIKLRTFCD